MKVLTVVGARPQFIKASAFSRAIAATTGIEETIVHTGQHFDDNMSAVFFRELGIPEPGVNLAIAGGTHGAMTGRMLEAVERVMLDLRPDVVLVYGDTNSTLAGALAAAKLHIPVAHIEAGLRSFNREMPEEINRILTDHLSDQLFCPTDVAVENLRREGIVRGVEQVGDVMFDVSLHYAARAKATSTVMQRLAIAEGKFALATCHRAENTDDPGRFAGIVEGLRTVSRALPVIWPVHPRTRKLLDAIPGGVGDVVLIDPLPFLDMVRLEQAASVIVTDSGGVQKEAYFYKVPCVTLRDQTEWVETVESGWNVLVGADADRIAEHVLRPERPDAWPSLYGDGKAAERIVSGLLQQPGRTQ